MLRHSSTCLPSAQPCWASPLLQVPDPEIEQRPLIGLVRATTSSATTSATISKSHWIGLDNHCLYDGRPCGRPLPGIVFLVMRNGVKVYSRARRGLSRSDDSRYQRRMDGMYAMDHSVSISMRFAQLATVESTFSQLNIPPLSLAINLP